MVKANRIALIGVCVLVSLFSSCASTIPNISDSARHLIAALNTPEYLPHRFKGTGTLTLSAGDTIQTMRVAWIGVHPDLLRFQAFDPWRNPLFMFILKEGKFYFHSAQTDQYYTGKGSRSNLKRVLDLPLEAKDLIAIFSGKPPVVPFTKAETRKVFAGGHKELLLFRRNHVVEKIEFDAMSGRAQKASFMDGLGKEQYRVYFDAFKSTGDVVFPHKIDILVSSGRRITLLADTIWTRFEIPKDAFTPNLSNAKRRHPDEAALDVFPENPLQKQLKMSLKRHQGAVSISGAQGGNIHMSVLKMK